MKDSLVLSVAFLGVIVAAKIVLAGPVYIASSSEFAQPGNYAVKTVSRRSIDGVFDAIANGFEGLMAGFKKVSDSVLVAFNGIFSSSNQNAITEGFEKFGKGLRDGANSLFGENGSKVTNGFKKIGDKIKGAFNGDSGKGGGNASPSSPKDTPSGEVPGEETT